MMVFPCIGTLCSLSSFEALFVEDVLCESDDDGTFAPNLYHVVAQLDDCESFRTGPRKPFAEFDDEMKTGDARLAVFRRGVSLAKLISAKPRTDALITTPRPFVAVNQIMQKMSAQSSGAPPVRQIQFVRLSMHIRRIGSTLCRGYRSPSRSE
jgi:hypothetical protein